MSAGVLFDAPGPKARARNRILSGIGILLMLVVAAAIVWKLDSKHQFTGAKWEPFIHGTLWRSYLLPGLWGTIKAALISIALASVLGVLLALARMSSVRVLNWFCTVWVEVFRAIPVLLMMIFSFGLYAYNNVFPSSMNALAGTVTGLTLYNSAVICEILRSGVDQVPGGQREAGLSIGLRPQQTLRSIMLPQAITSMLPTLVSQLVVILKDTALGYNITYMELLNSGSTSASTYSNMLPIVIVVALIYIVVNYSITKVAEMLEHRMRRRSSAPPAAAGGLAGAEPQKVPAT
ncbi:amino acid ABC transporter permease [Leekyejoonella antrihumi]|uniref:Amino acid ABC transporter permease n=1 Tax=Leekyejoonella antrihumi TaxID=1660198 RepID=A0A563DVR3_9MICO|nr:amino acid ABC transporter permease [Leekyejoonella antrihumi]TWP33814.1 amino acid ABC transporter permease [Leekyejoonella antrihumi]